VTRRWDYLVESDARLRTLARAYAAEDSDENAHALAREYLRQHSREVPKSSGGQSNTRALSRVGNKSVKNLVEITKPDDTTIIIHYNMPVAAFQPGSGYIYTKDGKARSNTTQAYIKAWIAYNGGRFNEAMLVDAEEIAALV
jgi:hypothetical protein